MTSGGTRSFELSEPNESSVDGRQQAHQVAEALARDEFHLVYQPKVNLRSGKVDGVEALLRWQHPQRGELSPGSFLPGLMEHDVIIELGTWVIRRALHQIATWQAHNIDLTVSVNIAPAQLLSPNFPELLRECLDAEPSVSPARLELEILESAALQDTDMVRNLIGMCREWGVTFSLDDFGTGYSSLSYLRQIPTDVIKIDQTFVRDLLDDEDDRQLVAGMISLSRVFRRVVVAEGVETAEQAIVLMRLGCDLLQGYGIARPMSATKIPGWVADFKPDESWLDWMDSKWDLDDLPLLMARSDHKSFVDAVLNEITNSDAICQISQIHDHRQCRFGRWYYHQGQATYGDLEAFIAIENEHRDLHCLATEALEAHRAGRSEDAGRFVRGLVEHRDQILGLLKDLQRVVKNRVTYRGTLAQKLESPARGEKTSIGGFSPVSVLVINSERDAIEQLAGGLAKDYTVRFAFNGNQALNMLAHPEKPDLILIDDRLPDINAFELCRQLKDNSQTSDIPVIFVVAGSDIEAQLRAFRVGGVDFLAKPLELQIVRARVRTHLNLKLRTELLERRASLDGMTGLPNRRQFDEALQVEWRRAIRHKGHLSLIMLDVDYFKPYNDHYGHTAGDECLRRIATVLESSLQRPGDFTGRYGGEEFVLILPDTPLAGARACAEKLRDQVHELGIPHRFSPVANSVTISVGCATAFPGSDSTPEQLLDVADKALYEAKRGGRNQVYCKPLVTNNGSGD